MSHATVFLILDAARADYVHADTMPFLAGLARESLHAQLDSPPGFAQRTALFSGRHPDTSGNFTAHVYDPDGSPFRWVRGLGPLRGLVQPRRAFYAARTAIRALAKRTAGPYDADPAWIPPRYLPFFRPGGELRPVDATHALGAPSLFDLCRDRGLRFRHLPQPDGGNDDQVHETLVRELRSSAPYDLYVAEFSAADREGHTNGPHSDALRTHVLPRLDEQLASVHAALEAGYDSYDLFVCGNHGMATVERRIDVLRALERVDARPAKDYVVFVNSTFALVWYLTATGRREIGAALRGVPGAHLVTAEERTRRRIPQDRRWGDAMLAAEPGVLFWPDYFHVRDSTVRGMHGYLDRLDEGRAAAVLSSTRHPRSAGDAGVHNLVDVFPTLCDLLGLPVPEGQEGSSLLGGPYDRTDAAAARRPPIPAPQEEDFARVVSHA